MADEIKNELEENENIGDKKKEMSPDEIVKSIFNRTVIEEKNAPKEGEVKKPVNIFSKPIPVLQTEEARRSRLKVVIIEGLLFGGFLTAITAINAFTGIADKISISEEVNTPSFWFFLFEFIIFSIVIGVGDYFLTERRVNNYNASVAGINVNIDDEIENALKEQEEAGITAEDAAAQNKSNGEEAAIIEVRCSKGVKSLTEKVFEAFIDDTSAGTLETTKGVITDANGFETIVLKVKSISANEGEYKNGVVMELLNAAKDAASDNSLAAIAVPDSVLGSYPSSLNAADKYKVTYSEGLKIQEAYPGALMGISGELK